MNIHLKVILTFILISFFTGVNAQLNTKTAENLIKRILPEHAAQFVIKPLNNANGKDTFQIESKNNKIVLSGNNGVSIASAFYYYLNEFCHCQVTWNGVNLHLPTILPAIKSKIRKASPYKYRYYLNYCTFNYSMSWWKWDRWEKEIDWMALHGINMPLAITGEEYIWHEVYKELGFKDSELDSFFSGPAYFAWFWMGNLDSWGGPLSFTWMNNQKELQQKILERERELGMKPVLPAFTGHVPTSFITHFPNAKLKKTNWNSGFADTYILDPEDTMFTYIGKKFLEKQTEIFGTDHLYSSDTFNENRPPSNDSTSLAKLSAQVYQGMAKADPKAVWVMQGWLFYNDRKFWKTPQVSALLNAVPNDHMIILDLFAEMQAMWEKTNAFYGKPWIWNMLNNFGGNVNMFGCLEKIATEPAKALNNSASGKMAGIGLTMEAIEQNSVLYELMMANAWTNKPINIDNWLKSYIQNRYGSVNLNTLKAWQILKETAYNGKIIRDGAESIITGRPTFDSVARWTKTKLNYPDTQLLPAWDNLVAAIETCKKSDGFQYDLVDVTRQVLANYASPLQKKWVKAYQQKDIATFDQYSAQFLELIDDLDQLLATRRDFMLGPWIASARSCGTNQQEKALYECNARDLITLWGDSVCPLHEYACRQWSGLLSDFYKVRWQKFFQKAKQALVTGQDMNTTEFEKEIQKWEWDWVNSHKNFPVYPSGNSIDIAKFLYKKYRNIM